MGHDLKKKKFESSYPRDLVLMSEDPTAVFISPTPACNIFAQDGLLETNLRPPGQRKKKGVSPS